MEWVVTVLTGIAVLILVSPLLMLGLTIFVLVPLALLAPGPTMIARSTFDCPVSGRRVNAEFVTAPDAAHPTDVRACSEFGDGRVACAKRCREFAATAWAPSPTVPRWALIADGTVYR